jgi:hypothetical protein
VYSWFAAVFGQLKIHTDLINHLALALRAGDAMRGFRMALRSVIRKRLRYIPNRQPSDRNVRANISLLDTFLPQTRPTNRLRRAVLLALANGCWTDTSTLDHYCSGCCDGPEDCLHKFEAFFVSCTTGCAPRPWPQSRWTGFDECLEWQGLLQCIHGLLTFAFREWAGTFSGPDAAQHGVPGVRAEPADLLALADDAEEGGQGTLGDPAGAAGGHDGRAERPQDDRHVADGDGQEVDYAEKRKEQCRSAGTAL